MSAITAEHDEHHLHNNNALSPAAQVRANRLGLWLFFISEIFLFIALLSARFYLWKDNGEIVRPNLDQTLGFLSTGVLLLSSYFMVRAETAIAHDNRQQFLNSLKIAFVLGLLFLIAVVGFEWGLFGIDIGGHEPLKLSDGAFGAVFYAMTGMHALHVVSGLIYILIVHRLGKKGEYSAEAHWPVEACALYWHYVDVVWVFFYPALYLIGSAVSAHG
ncbi:MAG TPA: heme-copper oxidase subunit III [Anaerolineae bacterium]|nr:heme-copper oxidase subunit III [Anaerolineae bacterium]